MKIIMIAPKTSTFINFRGDLMQAISQKGNEIVAICPEAGYEEVLQNLGARFELISLKKNSTTIFDNINYLNNLTKIIKKEKPDRIFAYTIKPVIFGSIAAKRAKVTEMYSMITGLGYVYAVNSFKTKILRIICGIGYKIAFKCNKKVIFQNKDDIDEFVRRKYLKREKCELVDGSGVNMERFKRNDLPKENTFLMVSRILKQKGVREYFEAAKIVKQKYPETQFLYVGAEDKTQLALNLEEVKEEFIDTGIINYCGESNDVPSYLAKCSVFVLPSYYREGIPRTLLEALAMGRPIITTDSIGCRETVRNGQNGFLIPIKDVQALANKMIYMIEHREELEKMADASYKYCKERFDVNIINKRMLEIMKIERKEEIKL